MESCWTDTNVGVLTSMNPLALSASAILASNAERSCLVGLAIIPLIIASFAASVLDMSLANCLSRSAASSNSMCE